MWKIWKPRTSLQTRRGRIKLVSKQSRECPLEGYTVNYNPAQTQVKQGCLVTTQAISDCMHVRMAFKCFLLRRKTPSAIHILGVLLKNVICHSRVLLCMLLSNKLDRMLFKWFVNGVRVINDEHEPTSEVVNSNILTKCSAQIQNSFNVNRCWTQTHRALCEQQYVNEMLNTNSQHSL